MASSLPAALLICALGTARSGDRLTAYEIAAQGAAICCSVRQLERYWDSIRQVFHTRELGLSLVREVEADRSGVSVSIKDALDSYLRLKGVGRSQTFQGAERAVGYLTETTDAEDCHLWLRCGALP